jgi:regulator of replication initiation timing
MRPVALDGIAAIVAENGRLRTENERLHREHNELRRRMTEAEAHGHKQLDHVAIRQVIG